MGEQPLQQNYGYRVGKGSGKDGSQRPILMSSKKSLAIRYYPMRCRHAPTAAYLKQFRLQDDGQCWWRKQASQTREHLFRHCKRWKHEQRKLWKAVGWMTGWKAGTCRHKQISELFSMEICDQAMIDFEASLRPRRSGSFHAAEQSVFSLSRSFFSLSQCTTIHLLSFVKWEQG